MTTSVLRGGIIGCGFFAQFQIDAWRRMPQVHLAAACDLDLERAKAAAPYAYSSAEEMFAHERLDFVDIATRPETHLDLVRLAISHRVPVICQKPLAPSFAQAVELARVVRESGVRAMVHENWRWQPWYRAVASLIAKGAIGNPITYRMRTVKRDGLGADAYATQPYFRQYPRLLLYETMVHHMDTARYLFGEIDWVYAQTRRNNPLIAGEDQAHVMLTHSNTMIGGVDGHRFLETDPSGPAMGEAWFEGDSGVLHVHPSGDVRMGDRTVWQNFFSDGYRGDSVLATQQHFIEGLLQGSPWESEVQEYLKTVALVEAAYESLQDHRAIHPQVPAEA